MSWAWGSSRARFPEPGGSRSSVTISCDSRLSLQPRPIGECPMPARLHPVFPRFLAILTAILAGYGCATNPATGKRQISFVSTSKEAQMGRESDPAVIEQYGIYGDSLVNRYVDSVGQRLAAVSQPPTLGW